MFPDYFVYGTQYYRPPNPPRDQHPRHLRRIKEELGFNIVRLRMQWNAVHRTQDLFDLDELGEILDLCDGLDLGVLIETSLESSPYWLERAHPESRYVSANGHAVELGPYESTQYGGYPGLCFHHEPVRREGERYLRALVRAVRDRRCVLGYDCWNEPHMEPAWIANYWANMGDRLFCYCAASRTAFRGWLEQKYGDIVTLNRTWFRAYGEWDDINPPDRHGHYADWLDWIRFWFDELADHMRWRYRIIKEEDPGRFVKSHSGAVPPFLDRPNAFINNWALAEPVDLWGTSFAPKAHNWGLAECAGVMDATISAGAGKPMWISEMSGGACNRRGFERTPVTRAKDIRAWNWLAAAYGARAILYWCYLTETTGPESGPGAYGLIKLNGEMTERAAEAARQARLLRECWPILRDHVPQPEVGVLYDPDNSSLLFAMENTDTLYTRSHHGYYRAIWRNDLHARTYTYRTMAQLVRPDGSPAVRVLLAPMILTLGVEAAVQLRAYVAAGGVLISDCRLGLYDERGLLQPELPAWGLSDVAGLREDEALCSDPDNRPWLNNPENLHWPDEIYGGPPVTIHHLAPGANGESRCVAGPVPSFRVRGYLAPLLLDGATPLGGWGDLCLAAHHRFGAGEVYYFGTYLGLALYAGDAGAHQVLGDILRRYVTPAVSGHGLRPRLIGQGAEAVLAVFNEDRLATREDLIELPSGYRRAWDLATGAEVPLENGVVRLQVAPEDAAILRLTD